MHILGLTGWQIGMRLLLLNCQRTKCRCLVPELVGNAEFLWAGIYSGTNYGHKDRLPLHLHRFSIAQDRNIDLFPPYVL